MYDKAESIFKSICALYSTDEWASLGTWSKWVILIDLVFYTRTRLAKCQQQLKHYLDYISSCLSLLAPESQTETEGKQYYFLELTSVAREMLPSGLSDDIDIINLFAVVVRDMKPLLVPTMRFPKGKTFLLGNDISFDCEMFSLFPRVIINCNYKISQHIRIWR